jgi:hypothetical protein
MGAELGMRRRLPSLKAQEQAQTKTEKRKLRQATADVTACKRARRASDEGRSSQGREPGQLRRRPKTLQQSS